MTKEELEDLKSDAKRESKIFCINNQIYTANELDGVDWKNTSYEELAACLCDIPNDLVIKEFDDYPDLKLTLGDLSETLQDIIKCGISRAPYWKEHWTR
jgi:hypothetical protein